MKSKELQGNQDLVLIADDDPTIRLLAGEALQQGGFRVEAVEDGQEALEAVEALQPDILMLDVSMPRLDGFSACLKIREMPFTDQLPILMMTGMDDFESITRAYEVGATDFLTKPINWVLLKHRVRYLLRSTRAVNALVVSEAKNQALFSAMPDTIVLTNSAGLIQDFKLAKHANHLEVFPQDARGKNINDVMAPEVAGRFLEHAAKALESGEAQVFDYKFKVGDRDLVFEARQVSAGADQILTIVRDQTEQKGLEEQLQQSQKMEALGNLAGGVAHDFNNALTVISGYAQILSSDATEQQKRRLSPIQEAVKHASSLTRRLLAFSKKQVLRPTLLDLNQVVSGMQMMLTRVIGEDVELRFKPHEALWRVKVDLGQMEQVIMNLAVNAREAMARGGVVTIETSNVAEGDLLASGLPADKKLIMLSVSDTGKGMDEKTRARIFEPFFTTKSSGTGLGLATVYGIVRQSQGDIMVESEPDQGTTLSIYLPSVAGAGRPGKALARRDTDSIPTGKETILLVEDEDRTRELVLEVLCRQGYRVLPARDGNQATSMAREYGEAIHMLLTDVVMPGMSGREVAERLTTMRPEACVLYMSGYTDDAMIRHGVSKSEVAFLQKPFTLEVLGRKVREVLDGANSFR